MFWSLATKQVSFFFQGESEITAGCFVDDLNLVVTGSSGGVVRFLDISNRKEIKTV